ncbi:MAG: ATP-binding protein [Clostridia bacterium]|nr:ATP-binding protein [Clostridia bacterium]
MKNIKLKNKVLNDIKSSKLRAEALADKVLEKAMQDEEFKNTYLIIKNLNFSIAKKEFLNQPTLEDKKALEEYSLQMDKILKKIKIKKEDLLPKYACTKCQDTGVINDNLCECFYNRLNTEIINNLGIKVDKSHTFENANFELFDKPEDIKKLYEKLQNWCENLENSKYKNLLLSGPTGVGKTYLVESICNNLISKNVIINYYTAFALNDLFLKYRTSFNENRAGLLDGVLQCDVLIIDDLGSEPNMKNNEEYFYSVFNERLTNNKSTVITTNLDLEQLFKRYGERTFSRLCNKANSVLIKINNADLRLKRK